MAFLLFLLVIICIVIFLLFSKLSLMTLFLVDEKGIHLKVKVMLYKILTIYQWDFKEGGLSFLLKKKEDVPDELKKKKGRLAGVLKTEFSSDTFRHLRNHLEVFDVSVKGWIASKDAALTALLYGGLWSLLGALIPFIPQKRLVFDFYPDFQKEVPQLKINCILRVRINHIIVLIVNNKLKKMRKGRSESYGTASN